ncbi:MULTISPECIES: hypothetical protein [unclassified Moorena]|uniref:hypothetical protein n=1 Tax=unclassified Moorena TaxID=2683338 RepID=UPI0013CC8264|nr:MULTISPECIES: hypothetical protein [unclassified Moorena]NEO22363.1 hypothetical protein [Moorena sp. SIO4A5]NEQ61066.1 hypothetical protein [Moorena sp. SIO4A1]
MTTFAENNLDNPLDSSPSIISSNQSFLGILDASDGNNPTHNGSFSDDFRLEGVNPGQVVQVQLEADFDTYLQLINADTEEVITYNDDFGGSLDSQLTFTVESDVDYLLRATSYRSSVTGEYTLTQRYVGNLEEGDSNNPTRNGRFSDDFHLEGVLPGQVIEVNLEGDFDTYLQLINRDTGEVIAEDDDGGEGRNSQLTFTAQSDVDYALRATSYGSGATGEYTLTTNGSTVSSLQGTSTQRYVGNLEEGDSNNPTRNGRFSDDFHLEGVLPGQVIEVNLEGDFDTYLQLINRDTGEVIAQDNDGGEGQNSQLTFTAQSDVAHALRATSYGSGATGEYTLTTNGSTVFSTQGTSTQRYVGNLEEGDDNNPTRNGRFSDDFHLEGVNPGQVIEVNLEGDFDTYLQLINRDTGEVIAEDDDGGEGRNSQLTFTAQSDVDYALRATSYGSGATGEYTLTTNGSTVFSPQGTSDEFNESFYNYQDLVRKASSSGFKEDEEKHEYKVAEVFTDEETGFEAYGFVPTDSDSTKPPVLVIAGSNDPWDWLYNGDPRGVGYRQFERNVDRIINWLNEITHNTKLRPDIIGESLGGVLAQSFAARYTSLGGKLSQVVSFNSPGINRDLANDFVADNVEKVTHIVGYGDIVSLLGDDYIEGEYKLAHWNTDNNDIWKFSPYIQEKHNQSRDLLKGSIINNLDSEDLSNSLFSYWDMRGVSSAARKDWALFNLVGGIYTLGVLPTLLSNRGVAESSRTVIGGVIEEVTHAIRNLSSDSPLGQTALLAGQAIDNLGDGLVNLISEWNEDMYKAVANWDPNLWTAIELSGAPALSYLAVGGIDAAEALASGGVLATSALLAGGAEAFEALAAGGWKATQALFSGDGTEAWEALAAGGEEAWSAIKARGVQAWDHLLDGGEEAWIGLKNGGIQAWRSLADGGQRAWDLISDGYASVTSFIGNTKVIKAFNEFGDYVQKLQIFPSGDEIQDFYNNTGKYLRNTFNSVGNIVEQVNFFPDGEIIQDFYNNTGNKYLRKTFNSVGNIVEQVNFFPDGEIIQDFYNNTGNKYLRKTFNSVGNIVEQVNFFPDGEIIQDFYNNTGNKYLRKTFNSVGNIIEQVEFLPDGGKVIHIFENGIKKFSETFSSSGEFVGRLVYNAVGEVIDGVGKVYDSMISGGKKVLDWLTFW